MFENLKKGSTTVWAASQYGSITQKKMQERMSTEQNKKKS